MKAIALVLALTCTAALAPTAARQGTPAERALDPKAVKALAQIGTKLRGLREYTVSAELQTRAPLASGEYRDFRGNVRYHVRTPDRLHATIRGIGFDRDVVFDGRTIAVFSPAQNTYARIEAPGTLATMVSEVEQRTGLAIPIAQLFRWDDQARLLEGAERATYSGQALVGGRDCAHYSYKKAGVAWEVFADAQHLPCKLAFVDTRDPNLPGYSAELAWDENARVPDAAFVFEPPAGANEIAWDRFKAQGQ